MNWILAKLAPVKPKALGPIESGYLDTSIRSQERMQNDVLPGQFKIFTCEAWIRDYRKHPKVPLSRLGGAR